MADVVGFVEVAPALMKSVPMAFHQWLFQRPIYRVIIRRTTPVQWSAEVLLESVYERVDVASGDAVETVDPKELADLVFESLNDVNQRWNDRIRSGSIQPRNH